MRSASLLLCVPLLTLACGGTEAGTGGAGGTGGSTSSTGGAGTTGGGGEGGAPVTYRVTVEVVGLDGQLELTLSPGSESLVVTSEGSHSFTAALLDGDFWEVALASAPGLQSCSADVSTGTIGGADASLTITCLDQLAFAASNVDPGDFELWATDGTEAGTRLILDIEPNGSSAPREITAVPGSLVIFTAATDAEGREPWVSDGTPEGTRLLADINPGTSGSSPHGFTLHAGTIYFQAQDPTSGNELWATDGTAAGTKRVADLYTGPNGSYPEYFTVLGDRLLFIASEPTQDSLLAIEPNGTLTTLAPATYDEMRVAAGLAYFSADLDDLGNEPFISDGTAAGTTRLADIATGAASSSPVPLAALPT
ncbi:MAG: hypothetical protein KC731_28495, partial [Myxococcales bacterium]|nr:hypothetical protein [Myxococcales bacterium]